MTDAATDAALAGQPGWLQRIGCQYHWHNRGYASYDDFLATLASRKRKALRKERERANAFGGEILSLRGDQIKPQVYFWDVIIDLPEDATPVNPDDPRLA